jgi:hypothetical protein
VILGGLYAPVDLNLMREALDDSGLPQWGSGIADHITVELHGASSPYILESTFEPVILNTTGICTITVPAYLSGSYYIVVKHRNSIETWSYIPLTFASSIINYDFTVPNSDPLYINNAYGDNMKQVEPGVYAIFGGDADASAYIDGDDFNSIDNTLYTGGYIIEDVDGTGYIDGDDFNIVDNTLYNGVISPVTP